MAADDREMERVQVEEVELVSTGLLSSYDRLRRRIVEALERRGRLGRALSEPLMLAPDLLVLLARLCMDRDVSPASRRLIVGALAYFLTPVDMLPEAFLGVGGFLDDVVLASLVLSHSLDAELEPLAVKHWSGNQNLRVVLADVSGAGAALLGVSLYERLKGFLVRRGVHVEDDV
ncbi:MAG: YkvA family protein [Thermoanaerobaculia bacterium]